MGRFRVYSRRRFLQNSLASLSATWVASHWPAALEAAQHAHNSAQSAAPPKFEFFTPEMAAEVDAIVARIIPTEETPGAREAGVVYFIDRAAAYDATGGAAVPGREDDCAAEEGSPELGRAEDLREAAPVAHAGIAPGHHYGPRGAGSTRPVRTKPSPKCPERTMIMW